MEQDICIFVIDDEMMILRDIEDVILSLNIQNYSLLNSSKEALMAFEKEKPDLILCDINLEEEEYDGISLIQHLRTINENFEVLYISAHTESEFIEEAQNAGAINYLFKPFDEEQLKVSLRLIINKIKPKQKEDALDGLTKSEISILRLIRKNYTSQEIADQLYVSAKTIKNHRYNICKKLNLPPKPNSLLTWVLKQENI